MIGRLAAVRNTIQVDIGFGDALEGGPRSTSFRRLLDETPLEVITYPIAAVLAEKFETMIALGSVNSRMKDFYDLWFILQHAPLSDGEILSALRVTFGRRGTAAPERPAVFSHELASSEAIQLLWRGFTRRSKLGGLALERVLSVITRRLEPLYSKLRAGQN